ncbi:MAG TPA: ABC transporter permease [Bacillota bacterium]|nr:ABC transporter permease [Bacillota bacterium]HOB42054.1 ABC transporter permease [Bacillota bacterium]HOO30261.1 ABC transporter permease [Bacillota bacterium]HPZ13728.1 ABC transporter permease [Bacillota bacterium]HQD79990.1 ABC transporter permease [Bacillota bacterium]
MGHVSIPSDELCKGVISTARTVPYVRASRRRGTVKRLLAHGGGRTGLIIVAAFVLVAVLAPVIAPYAPDEVDLDSWLIPPGFGSGHLLGTDQLGRDILSRIIYGSRVSILVGLTTILISSVVGIGLGMLAGYYGGALDRVLARFTELLLAFPYLIFVIAIMSVIGPGFWNLVWALSFKGWVEFYRLARALTMSEKNREYVDAARALGRSDGVILVREILPNISNSMLVLGTLRMGNMIMTESSLSFLGLGIPPRIPAWGSMIADGRRYMLGAWWVATLPGIALALLVLGMNLLGEGLRDVLDPKMMEG